MKKIIKRQLLLLTVFLSLLLFNPVKAQEVTEDNKDSIVQVVMIYKPEKGENIILQSGSGIVINSNTILTNYHLVHMKKSDEKKAWKYIRSRLGKKVNTSSDSDRFQTAIVKKGDVLITGDVSNESKEEDFAILTLQEETDRTAAVLGNSDTVAVGTNTITIGYPTMQPFQKKGTKLYKKADANLIGGVVSLVKKQSIRIGSAITPGNSGGAVLDASNGQVIGLCTYRKKDAQKECFRAVPINEIKYYLQDISYTDGSVQQEETTQEAAPEEAQQAVDKTHLKETIDQAVTLQQKDYKSESFSIFASFLQQAQQIMNNEQAQQDEVDNAQKLLQQSMDALEKQSSVSVVWIVVIVVGAILFITAVAAGIMIYVKSKAAKRERDRFVTIPENYQPNRNAYTAAAQEDDRPVHNDPAAVSMQPKPDAYSAQNDATTVLNDAGMAKENETMVLNMQPAIPTGYLVRKATGERSKIDSLEFTIGKDKMKVNLPVLENAAISRCHMKIVQRGITFFAVDLNSTNYTYINGEKLEPGKEYTLANGDVIKLADEEFEFDIEK